MNLEDVSVVMKLCDDNVLKLHENLRSYQRDVRRVKKLMTKRWAKVERLDRGIIALHDQLVGSLSEVNAYIIKLNLHIDLNRPLDRFTEEERSEDSLDELCSPNNASVRAIKGGSSDETDEQSQEQASIEKSLEDSTQLVPVDLSLRFVESSMSSSQSFDEPKVAIPKPPVLAPTSTPKLTRTPSNESLLSPRISNQTISNDTSKQNSKKITELEIIENPMDIESFPEDLKISTQTSNSVSQQKSKNISPLQIEENPVGIKDFQEEPKVAHPTSNKVSPQTSKSITSLQIEESQEITKSYEKDPNVATLTSNNVSQQKCKTITSLQIKETPVVTKPFQEEPKDVTLTSSNVTQHKSKPITPLQMVQSPEIVKSFQEDPRVITPTSNDVSQQKSKNTTSLQIKESTEIIKKFQGDPKVSTPTTNYQSNSNFKNITPLPTKKNPALATLPSTWLIDPPDQVPTSPSATISKHPKTPRSQTLLPPKGGTQTTSTGIYNQILRNMAAFPSRTLVAAALVHVNLADDCIYVAKWDESSERIQKVLQGQVALQELDQLPDYGEIFAVLDSSDNITTRMTINSSCAVGGYYGYLIDYGEHIHLNGYETIYELPDDIKRLPAEAIRAKLVNYDIGEMKTFLYSVIQLRVLENNGIELVVEVIEDNLSKVRLSLKNKTDSESRAEVSEEDMAMLNEIEESTSDPLKAVLGFRPTDEQRICRHYDPKINGCFKGNNCRLVHEPFAPYGATKDVEVAAPLPETLFDTPVPFEIGSIVRILITFINGPTEVYAQFLDGSAPLVWEEKDVPVNKRHFKHKPHILDIVLALYSDGCFYRAQIIDELDKEYKIFYVDYGNTEFVPLSSLAPCNDVERLKPHRCISCHFEGVVRSTLLTHQETFECVEYLKSKVLNREMNVRLVNRLPDGFMIRFLGDWKEVPRHLINRKYVDPVNGKRRDSDGEED